MLLKSNSVNRFLCFSFDFIYYVWHTFRRHKWTPPPADIYSRSNLLLYYCITPLWLTDFASVYLTVPLREFFFFLTIKQRPPVSDVIFYYYFMLSLKCSFLFGLHKKRTPLLQVQMQKIQFIHLNVWIQNVINGLLSHCGLYFQISFCYFLQFDM